MYYPRKNCPESCPLHQVNDAGFTSRDNKDPFEFANRAISVRFEPKVMARAHELEHEQKQPLITTLCVNQPKF